MILHLLECLIHLSFLIYCISQLQYFQFYTQLLRPTSKSCWPCSQSRPGKHFFMEILQPLLSLKLFNCICIYYTVSCSFSRFSTLFQKKELLRAYSKNKCSQNLGNIFVKTFCKNELPYMYFTGVLT